jgi:hypothetical protein
LNSDNIISSYTISATELEQFRANFPAWMDSDRFEISTE